MEGCPPPLPCSPHTPCRPQPRPAWNDTCSPPCTTACCRRSVGKQRDTVPAVDPGTDPSLWHRSNPLARRAQPQPRAPAQSPLPTRDPTHIHVIAEGGVGAVLQPALVAHIVQDARGHQGKVQHLLGWGVIQAQPPAPAGRDRSQQCHPRHPTPPADAGGNSS